MRINMNACNIQYLLFHRMYSIWCIYYSIIFQRCRINWKDITENIMDIRNIKVHLNILKIANDYKEYKEINYINIMYKYVEIWAIYRYIIIQCQLSVIVWNRMGHSNIYIHVWLIRNYVVIYTLLSCDQLVSTCMTSYIHIFNEYPSLPFPLPL